VSQTDLGSVTYKQCLGYEMLCGVIRGVQADPPITKFVCSACVCVSEALVLVMIACVNGNNNDKHDNADDHSSK